MFVADRFNTFHSSWPPPSSDNRSHRDFCRGIPSMTTLCTSGLPAAGRAYRSRGRPACWATKPPATARMVGDDHRREVDGDTEIGRTSETVPVPRVRGLVAVTPLQRTPRGACNDGRQDRNRREQRDIRPGEPALRDHRIRQRRPDAYKAGLLRRRKQGRHVPSGAPALCQSNGRSLCVANTPTLKRHLGREGTPLGQCGRASLLLELASDEMALMIEMLVDLGVN
jgi:hypothetical protein